MKKPSIAPAGPPRPSQSSMMTSQPAPAMLPKPNVKYSRAPRLRRRLVGRDSKLVFQCREQLLGAPLAWRAGGRRALEIPRCARRILRGPVHGFNRHTRFAGHVRIGPEAQAMRARELSGLEKRVLQIQEAHGNRIGAE